MIYTVKLVIAIMPVVMAGIMNMIFVKIEVFNSLKVPMDRGIVLKDGKRLFGDNKTWKGFLGMSFFTCIFTSLFAYLYQYSGSFRELSVINYDQINFVFWGLVWGLAYVLAELPNSYIKRRLEISPGTNANGIKGLVFVFVDQADSVFGCLMILWLFSTLDMWDVAYLFFIATALHLFLNYGLYLVGLKNQPA